MVVEPMRVGRSPCRGPEAPRRALCRIVQRRADDVNARAIDDDFGLGLV